jgi:chemotaxis protein methyltransferase CheR
MIKERYNTTLSTSDYVAFKAIIFKEIVIELGDSKQSLVQTRLLKRIVHHKLDSFGEYLEMVKRDNVEKNEMMNLITTNETYFFREQAHFDFLEKELQRYDGREKYRIWSAAASSGAEAYSIAMTCDTNLAKNRWEVVGTDINSDVIKTARMGLYPEAWVDKIPLSLRKKYCLKGRGRHEGQFLVDRTLSKSMKFSVNNLMLVNREIGSFNTIFLRNVLIYFNSETKKKVVENVMHNLKVGGYLIISLTENINNLKIKNLKQINSSIYQKIA